MDISQKGKGYKKEKFRLKHLWRRRLDMHLKFHPEITAPTPIDVLDIAKQFPVKDQGSSGSCGGQAWSYYIEALKFLRDGEVTPMSAHDIYSHSWSAPEGADEGDLINFVTNNGCDTESDVPSYMINGVPPTEAWMEIPLNRNVDVATEQIVFEPQTLGSTLQAIKQGIDVGNGCVIAVWGDNPSWTTSNGIVGIPTSKNWGHWIYAVAYNDSTQLMTVKNSWGSEMGVGGYYYIPYTYFDLGFCMGGWIFALEPSTYYIGLLQTIENLIKNIIALLIKKVV